MQKKTLKDLNINETAYIYHIDIESNLKYRLLALGFVKNEKITALYKNIRGGIISYKIRETHIALRQEEAEKIFVIY